jgi:hypothetical protein
VFGSGRLVGFAACVDGGAYARGLITDEALATLDEFFPLRTTAVKRFASAIDVIAYLILTAIDQVSDSAGGLAPFRAEILGTIASALCNIFPGFATTLGRIQNANQGAYAESRKKPRQTLSSGIISHNGISPSNLSSKKPERTRFHGTPQNRGYAGF